MKFSEFICFKACIAGLESETRNDAITELVDALDKAGRLPKGKSSDIAKAVIKREKEASTGMGKGVAIPHVKHSSVSDITAVIGISTRGIDFAALDEQPVYSLVLLISPADNPDTHLQAMENIFKHLQNEKFRKFLRQCKNQEQIEDLLTEADENPSW
jgi:PTS system nitrogen regulatory IIA component